MPKIDTLDALNDETTSMLKTLTHSLSFSGSKRYIYIGGNKSFGAHTAESLCFQWDADVLHNTHTEQNDSSNLSFNYNVDINSNSTENELFDKLYDFSCSHIF